MAGFVDPKNTCSSQLLKACDPKKKRDFPELISEADQAAYLNCVVTGKGLPPALQAESMMSKYKLRDSKEAGRNFWKLIHDPCLRFDEALYSKWSEDAGSAVLVPATSAGKGAKSFLKRVFTRLYHLDLDDVFTPFTEQALAVNVIIYDDGKKPLDRFVENINYDIKKLFQSYEDKDLKKYGIFLDFVRLSPERKTDFPQAISRTVGEFHAYLQEGGKLWFLLSPNGENNDVMMPSIGNVKYEEGDVVFGVGGKATITVKKDKRYPIPVANKNADALVSTIRTTLLSCGPYPCEIILTDIPEDWDMFPVIQTEIKDILEERKRTRPEISKTVFLTLKDTNGEIITRKISAFDYYSFASVVQEEKQDYTRFFTQLMNGKTEFLFFPQKASALSCVTGENLLHCAQNYMLNTTAGIMPKMTPSNVDVSYHLTPLASTALKKLFAYSLRTLSPSPQSNAAWNVGRDGEMLMIAASGEVNNLENLRAFYDKKENAGSAKVIPVTVSRNATKMNFEKGLEQLAAALRDLPVGPFSESRRELLIEIRREK